jgi:quinol monooxygenase YgiN
MSAIGIIATLTVIEGQNEAFETAFAAGVAAVRANEPGNHLYTLTRSNDDPQVYKVMEIYADEAALAAHGLTDHFKDMGRALRGTLAGPPVIERLNVVA